MSTVENEEEKHLVAMAIAIKRPHSPDDMFGGGNKHNEAAPDIHLFDLPWEDVLIPKVVSYLSVKELFKLRMVSSTAKRLSEGALRVLKNLDLSFNEAKNIIAGFHVLASHCHHLERLQLMRCRWLCDELLLQLLRPNTRLRELNLSDCVNITAQSLQPVIVGCKNLRKLELSNCLWLTTGAVDALTLHHCNLEYLDLSGCMPVNERALVRLFKIQHKLNTLSLANMPFVTDQLLLTIAQYCPLLEILNVQNCNQITDVGIQAIATQCRHLQSLFVKGCRQVNEHTLAPLRRNIFIDRAVGGEFYHYQFYPNDYLIY